MTQYKYLCNEVEHKQYVDAINKDPKYCIYCGLTFIRNQNVFNRSLILTKEELEKQLIEAKEIIKVLLNIIDYLNEDEYGKEDFPIVHKAENFSN